MTLTNLAAAFRSEGWSTHAVADVFCQVMGEGKKEG